MNLACPVKYEVDFTGDPELGTPNPEPFLIMAPFSCGAFITDQGLIPFTQK
jgi:hypothetical protein